MKKHWRYLCYISRHKWFVLVAGCKLGIPLLAMLHDISKFRPSEWFPYAEFFYGSHGKLRRDATGYYRPTDNSGTFDFAWLLHQKRNRHHWQFWVLPLDDGGTQNLPMPDRYRKEMLADWIGAGKAQGKSGTAGWYLVNRNKMQLHPETREWIEHRLDISE
jgi:hypothetical protein